MMNHLPPSPAASPPPNGRIHEQKENAIEFISPTNIQIPSQPPGLSTPEDRDEPSPATSRDYTPRVEDYDESGFKGPQAYPQSATPEVTTDDNAAPNRPSVGSFKRERTEFPRISRPVELMRNSYDYVVIGSGYGGAVAASRLARSVGRDGRNSVCVLERGMERWPGEYPSTTSDGLKNLYVSGEFAPGNAKGVPVESGDPSGMYRLVLGKGLSAVVGNGKLQYS